MPNEVTNI